LPKNALMTSPLWSFPPSPQNGQGFPQSSFLACFATDFSKSQHREDQARAFPSLFFLKLQMKQKSLMSSWFSGKLRVAFYWLEQPVG
jgi:hypothetical protein